MSAVHDTADVVVIGGGGAGLTAAAHAAAEGASVIVLEKAPHPGGSTGLSVGSFSAARTTYQRRAGVEDTVADFIADMATANGDLESRENTELRELLARDSGPAFEWLAALGIGFLGPTPEPPFRLPRMHNVMPHSGVYITALLRECRRRGVQIVLNARVDALLTGEEGEVLGARASGRRYSARRGVILATGDYSAAADLKARFVHPDAAAVPPINTAATGDGHRLGTAAGGQLTQMDRLAEGLRFTPLPRSGLVARLPASRATSGLLAWGARQAPRVTARVARGALTSWMAPSAAMIDHGAILVSRHGRRLADESVESAQARATARSGGPAYLVFDHAVAQLFSGWPHPVSTFPGVAYAYVPDYRRLRPDVYHEAPSLHGLAARIGAEADVLGDTVQRWNSAVAGGQDLEFGRKPPRRGIDQPPYYALGPLHPFVTLADGGLTVDPDLRVLRPDGSAIPGLRAAGSAGQGGLQLVNHGLHIAWAVVSGRRAGTLSARDPARDAPLPLTEPPSALPQSPNS
ncbi:FAD-dependent oxidoreductase [Sediminivirga luteola]|uniref:FAD-dependent oxidoreductase 2 FAD-binding domain-containing protein n=1 Tax=Sediminivirga luteola TaxID=1774748 RepID=A0A8J2XK13_9MICO|nr:FAD-dependent oxidoreductase [Sediminivirga luteola]GGA10123.1 hypothetical protein GCM10011333_11060 [Sediminivirga luteola]